MNEAGPRILPEAIGDVRNARNVMAAAGPGRAVTYFAGPLTPEQRAEIARVAPNVRLLSELEPNAAVRRAGEADGIDARYATPEFLAAAKKLVWIQTTGAGVERYLLSPEIAQNDRIILTNYRGVYGPAIADHAMAMLLSLTRDLPYCERLRAERRWRAEDSRSRPIALVGRTMLVVGLGGIGLEVARRAQGFGMRVMGVRRSSAPSGPGIERVGLQADLPEMLPQADVVAICVPLTRQTNRLFDRVALAAMKPRSYLLNLSRGAVVDTDALVTALACGVLAGAGLDVVEPEPLPADHPLWEMPNVVLTPHIAGFSEVTPQLHWAVTRENLRRFGAGEPMLNVVDKQAGY